VQAEGGCVRANGWAAGTDIAGGWILSAAPSAPPGRGPDPLQQILQFTYTVAHALGLAVIGAVQRILPQATIPPDLVDPVGFLAVLTVFVLLAGVARRLAWIIVVVGWVLIGVRIALAILRR